MPVAGLRPVDRPRVTVARQGDKYHIFQWVELGYCDRRTEKSRTMQSHTGCKILVVTSDRQNPERVRAMFPHNGEGKDILVAKSYLGALEMARMEHPEVCILSEQMIELQGRSFPDALKEASPETEIFIADDGDFANGKFELAAHDS